MALKVQSIEILAVDDMHEPAEDEPFRYYQLVIQRRSLDQIHWFIDPLQL